MTCDCGKLMIKRGTGMVLTSYPPQYPWNWWCGGCNIYKPGGIDRSKSEEQIFKESWEEENRK